MGIRSLRTASISTGAKRSKFWDQSANVIATSYISLGSVKLASNTTTVTFSSIPSTYKNLQIRIFARKDTGGNDAYALHLNGDTTNANYAYHLFGGDGTAFTQTVLDRSDSGSVRDNAWNSTVITIPDYTSTSKVKSWQTVSGTMSQTDGSSFYGTTVWDNTAAINSLRFSTINGSYNFITGSVFALYGIKG
jgi:hypothetical protein